MKKMLITGGAGFIGANASQYFLSRGYDIHIIDNLSRETARTNIQWLQKNYPLVKFSLIDLKDHQSIQDLIKENTFDVVIHLAAQVAVTTSVQDPLDDFLINAFGTFNILHALVKYSPQTFFINASTNKVYGKVDDHKYLELENAYTYANKESLGISEKQQLDFFSPYGCSKGTADQYTLDFFRIYGLKTVSLRQSCIYGPHQFGIEDQGWVAWFIIAALQGKNLSIYGNGKQVRDLLHVQDLLRFYDLLIQNKEKVAGQAFNIGGGIENSVSLLQLITHLKTLGLPINFNYAEPRPGDQLIFVSDNTKAYDFVEFTPLITWQEGTLKLVNWLKAFYLKSNDLLKPAIHSSTPALLN